MSLTQPNALPADAPAPAGASSPAPVYAVLRRVAARPLVLDLAIATLATLLIASPLLFTSNGFAQDFTNALWLVGYQQHQISAHLHPSLFMQTQGTGVFNPTFAFYGGPLFAISGALAVILGGSTVLAFILVTLAGIAAAYGGLLWLARQLGVRGLAAHAPALVFITSAYYATNLYGRGDWPEFMAVSALPLLAAASLRLIRGPLRAGPVACLIGATVIATGSHNLTLLWAATIAVVGLAVYWVLSGFPRDLPWRRFAVTGGLILLGACLNGWVLFPDLAYSRDTLISGYITPWSWTEFFNTPGIIFDPIRTVPAQSYTPALYVQAPVLALAWGLIAAPLGWGERRLRSGIVTVLVVFAGLLVVIMSGSVWGSLPTVYQDTQFAFRLESYVALSCAAMVLLGALALTRRAARVGGGALSQRALWLGLGLALAFGVSWSAWQLWVPETHTYDLHEGTGSYNNREEALKGPYTVLPKSWYAENGFGDRSVPVLEGAFPGFLTLEAAKVKDNQLSESIDVPQGPFATNISGGPNLVHVGGGVHVVGRTDWGYLVLERNRPGSAAVPVKLSAQLSAPVLLGRIASYISALVLLALALIAAVRRWRGRSRATPAPAPDPPASA